MTCVRSTARLANHNHNRVVLTRPYASSAAGLLAMKTSRLISFSGSMAALTVMTVLSVLIGQV